MGLNKKLLNPYPGCFILKFFQYNYQFICYSLWQVGRKPGAQPYS